MTDLSETVAELRRLDAEATPGDWRQVSGKLDGDKVFGIAGADQPSGQAGPVVCVVTTESNAAEIDVANAAFILALRNALPTLLAAAEDRDRLRAALEWLYEGRGKFVDIRAALSASRDLDRGEVRS